MMIICFWVTVAVLVLAPVYAFYSDVGRDTLGFSLIFCVVMLIFLWIQYPIIQCPVRYSKNALEIHTNHLCLTTRQGVLTIPKAAIYGIADNEYSWFTFGDGISEVVTMLVADEYKTPNNYGLRVNPSLDTFCIEGATDFTIRSTLITWLNS